MTDFAEIERLCRESHDAIIKLEQALLGTNGQGGIMRRVEYLENHYARLNRNFWILVALLAGSGVLGGSIWVLVV